MKRVRDGQTRWGKSDRERQISYDITYVWTVSLVAQKVKNLPAMKETQVQSLGLEDALEEDLLEEGTATHSSILTWRISWTEEHAWLQFMGLQELDTTEQLTLYVESIVKKKWNKCTYLQNRNRPTDIGGKHHLWLPKGKGGGGGGKWGVWINIYTPVYKIDNQ